VELPRQTCIFLFVEEASSQTITLQQSSHFYQVERVGVYLHYIFSDMDLHPRYVNYHNQSSIIFRHPRSELEMLCFRLLYISMFAQSVNKLLIFMCPKAVFVFIDPFVVQVIELGSLKICCLILFYKSALCKLLNVGF
jgi:hypothetical protein